jgi:hypothetical protein
MSCPSLETLAAWCLAELPEADADSFEQHYFSCDGCLEQAERMQRVIEQLRASLPPVLTTARRTALETSTPALRSVSVAAGQRASLRLGADAPVAIWCMQAPLERVQRVDFEARNPDGSLLMALPDVPFDAARGEVVLACQLHYRGLQGSLEMHVSLIATGPTGRRPLGEYILDHDFESL